MAKIKKGIFGPISGKLGPVVGATWNGIPYLRRAPKKTRKKRTRTVLQLANEEKMKFTNELLMPFHPYIKVGFQQLAVENTAISAAYTVNFHRAVIGEYPDLRADYTQLVLSVGYLPKLKDAVIELIDPQILQLTWQTDPSPRISFDDQVMLVVYSPELNLADGFTGGAKRNAYQCLFRFDKRLKGKALEVYVSVTSLDRKKIADSTYMGRVGAQ
jgi:hypothetical protein